MMTRAMQLRRLPGLLIMAVTIAGAALIAAAQAAKDSPPAGFSFRNTAREAGLTAITVYGGTETNKYLLETTGCGVAVFDFDGDGWLDVFLVNGSVLEGFPSGGAPTAHLYRNRHDGTFEDVTAASGLTQHGWGQAACAGDYDNDGHDDLFVTYWGQNRLFHNRGDRTFEDVTERAGLKSSKPRWGAGCAFLDYDRDGRLDLFAANYIDFDRSPNPVCAATRVSRLPAARRDCPEARTCSTTTRAAADSRTHPSAPASRGRAAPTVSVSVPWISTTTDGWISTSPTTPIRVRCI